MKSKLRLFISVANSDQFGNHFTIARKALLNDGLLRGGHNAANQTANLFQCLKQVCGFNKGKRENLVNEKALILKQSPEHHQ